MDFALNNKNAHTLISPLLMCDVPNTFSQAPDDFLITVLLSMSILMAVQLDAFVALLHESLVAKYIIKHNCNKSSGTLSAAH